MFQNAAQGRRRQRLGTSPRPGLNAWLVCALIAPLLARRQKEGTFMAASAGRPRRIAAFHAVPANRPASGILRGANLRWRDR